MDAEPAPVENTVVAIPGRGNNCGDARSSGCGGGGGARGGGRPPSTNQQDQASTPRSLAQQSASLCFFHWSLARKQQSATPTAAMAAFYLEFSSGRHQFPNLGHSFSETFSPPCGSSSRPSYRRLFSTLLSSRQLTSSPPPPATAWWPPSATPPPPSGPCWLSFLMLSMSLPSCTHLYTRSSIIWRLLAVAAL